MADPFSAEELEQLREIAPDGGLLDRLLATLDARDEEIEELVRRVEELTSCTAHGTDTLCA